ncbi:hypothetical protein [Pseudoalteromonas luteoviolacea]|uniref:hypothetical protein n=1 Tax=Pseudoalteromonas luteoviolacea TaxID=43657 RepID=UPI001B368EE0|nr:hypothetical protein [Pseudoalteromonas luteoviolacea]MBQ4836522.1 hypothetical protein [Pseudoalteromonas luteoviolacea]
MDLKLNLQSDSCLDLAFGKVISGKEAQVFQTYFPAVAPALQEFGLKPLRPFAVLDTNIRGPIPEQGNLTYVPSVENFVQFHQDARFQKAKPIRDEGMEFLADGNLFKSIKEQITLDSNSDYALILSSNQIAKSTSLFELNLSENSPNQRFRGQSLSLCPWSEDTEKLLHAVPNETIVLKVRFFPESS